MVLAIGGGSKLLGSDGSKVLKINEDKDNSDKKTGENYIERIEFYGNHTVTGV
jgi:hypothetical protein